MTREKTGKWFANSILALSLLLVSSAAMAGQASPPLTGAIFTTTIYGVPVNNNIYDHKEAVYLNGGPQPNRKCDAAGLPTGVYYFQVTDPSGKVLLSSDPIADRRVEVTGGVFIDNLSVTNHFVAQDDPSIPIARCGGYNVQLAPFDNTPNPGGEYKVWITRVGDYDTYGLLGSFGFLPSKTKTDNFKVVNPAATDTDGDGIPDGQDSCPLDPLNFCGDS
jgi:hypothetical protein